MRGLACLADVRNRQKAHQRRDRAGYLRQQIRKGEKGARPEDGMPLGAVGECRLGVKGGGR